MCTQFSEVNDTLYPHDDAEFDDYTVGTDIDDHCAHVWDAVDNYLLTQCISHVHAYMFDVVPF